MASLAELARLHTDLDAVRVGHLQRLVANWGMLADFCFADLLLFAPVRASERAGFVVLGQVRPTTGQTVYRRDWVGAVVDESDRPVVSRTFRLGEIIEGETNAPGTMERVRVLGIPVRYDDDIVAVLTRESAPLFGRQPGELERTYVEIFNRFARMIAAGDFPFARDQVESEVQARVGDGVDPARPQSAGRVQLAERGLGAAPHGRARQRRGHAARGARSRRRVDRRRVRHAAAWSSDELERGPEVTVGMRCIPLVEQGQVAGAVVLLRDISELRRRDRLLLSKDATIREIHHRVKNNLQTISSLLRLQGRRLESPEAKAAIEESVRRVRSIALVHEILSREAGGDAPFIDIVRPLCRMVEEALYTPERPVRCSIEGDAGTLPATSATPSGGRAQRAAAERLRPRLPRRGRRRSGGGRAEPRRRGAHGRG